MGARVVEKDCYERTLINKFSVVRVRLEGAIPVTESLPSSI